MPNLGQCIKLLGALLPMILVMVLNCTAFQVPATPLPPVDELTPAMLEPLGISLPGYMTLTKQDRFQHSLAVHQHLIVEWDAYPGRDSKMTKQKAISLTASHDFKMSKQDHHVDGACQGLDQLAEYRMVIAGVDSSGEIRGLLVTRDPTMEVFEVPPAPQGGGGSRVEFVEPRGDFDFTLPDDPTITRIVFLKPRTLEATPGYRLEKVGEIAMSSNAVNSSGTNAVDSNPVQRVVLSAQGQQDNKNLKRHKVQLDSLSMQQLYDRSDAVLLGQIEGNSCQLSPSGEDVIAQYTVSVVSFWKTRIPGDRLYFSAPNCMFMRSDQSMTATITPGFHILKPGGRYILFLRFSQPLEQYLTPALRLTNEAVEGAFEISRNVVTPAYSETGLARQLASESASQMIQELTAINDADHTIGFIKPRK